MPIGLLVQIPGAPVHMHVNTTPEAIFTVVCALPLVVGVALSVRELLRGHAPLALLCIVGGATATIVEPLLDANGGVWWPAGGWEAFTLAGVHIPLLVPFVYPWLLGGQGYLAWRAFERRASARSIWRLVGLFAFSDLVLETIGVLLKTYSYYGNQPLNFWGLPLWYVPLNAGGPLIAGAIFYLLRPYFGGARTLALLAVFPMSFALMYHGAGFPVWLSVQSNWPKQAATVAAIATFGLSYMLIRVFLVATRTPGAVHPTPPTSIATTSLDVPDASLIGTDASA